MIRGARMRVGAALLAALATAGIAAGCGGSDNSSSTTTTAALTATPNINVPVDKKIAAQVPSSKIVGQFSAPGGDTWGALLEKDSKLTSCVSQAIEKLKGSGALEKITQKWMGQSAGAPELN